MNTNAVLATLTGNGNANWKIDNNTASLVCGTYIGVFEAASAFGRSGGMRPDFISEQNTPTLANLARHGVTFANHHSVYLSATEVNGTALATGAYPSQSGIMANKEYRPRIDMLKPIGTGVLFVC